MSDTREERPEALVRYLGLGWQPIETAPKDGTPMFADYGDGVLYVAKFNPPDVFSDGHWQMLGYFGGRSLSGMTLTSGGDRKPPKRWQPLPAPPSSTRTTGGEDG